MYGDYNVGRNILLYFTLVNCEQTKPYMNHCTSGCTYSFYYALYLWLLMMRFALAILNKKQVEKQTRLPRLSLVCKRKKSRAIKKAFMQN